MITKTTRTFVTVECDKCQVAAPGGYTNREAIDLALENNFIRARTRNYPHKVYFFCHRCADQAIEELGSGITIESIEE